MKISIALTTTLFLAAAGLALALEPRSPSASQFPTYFPQSVPHTITVSVTGKAHAEPSSIRLAAKIKQTAELGEEAVANYVQARARTMAGFEDVGLDGLEIVAAGLEIEYMSEPNNENQQMFVMNGMPAPDPGVTCQESLEVHFQPTGDKLARVGQVARAVDMAVELGLDVGVDPPNPYNYNPNATVEKTVQGELSSEDKTAADAAAQADGMERARVLAANLAQLSGRTLGGVNSVSMGALTSEWQGLGVGVQVTATMSVTFDLE